MNTGGKSAEQLCKWLSIVSSWVRHQGQKRDSRKAHITGKWSPQSTPLPRYFRWLHWKQLIQEGSKAKILHQGLSSSVKRSWTPLPYVVGSSHSFRGKILFWLSAFGYF